MKSALIAFSVTVALCTTALQAKTPYQDMGDNERALLSGGVGKNNEVLQLLNLGTIGRQQGAVITEGLNVSEERANASEMKANVSALGISALLMPRMKDGAEMARAFWKTQFERTGLKDFEHDHLVMTSIVYDAATYYFSGGPSTVVRDVDAFLRTQDIKRFKTGCFESSEGLVDYLNSLRDGSSPMTLAAYFNQIQVFFGKLPIDVSIAAVAAPLDPAGARAALLPPSSGAAAPSAKKGTKATPDPMLDSTATLAGIVVTVAAPTAAVVAAGASAADSAAAGAVERNVPVLATAGTTSAAGAPPTASIPAAVPPPGSSSKPAAAPADAAAAGSASTKHGTSSSAGGSGPTAVAADPKTGTAAGGDKDKGKDGGASAKKDGVCVIA